MQTTCPECRTTYRIAQAQLSLRRGLVRCGHCNTVFNAYDSLLPDLNAEPTPAPAPARIASRLSPPDQEPASLTEVVWPAPAQTPHLEAAPDEAVPLEPEDRDLEAAAPEAAPAPAAAPYAEAYAAAQDDEPPAQEVSPVTAPSLMQAAEETSDSILLSALPVAPRAEASPRTQRWLLALYGLLALLLLTALALQLTWFLRAEIANTWPVARPLLTRACAHIGCTVALPRQLGKEAVISSSLEHDPENRSRVRLTLLLANRTGQAQAWPDVVLTLTDVRDSPVGQTPFKPNAYLPKGANPAAGMPPESEWEIRLDLEIGSLDASGYALDLVYP